MIPDGVGGGFCAGDVGGSVFRYFGGSKEVTRFGGARPLLELLLALIPAWSICSGRQKFKIKLVSSAKIKKSYFEVQVHPSYTVESAQVALPKPSLSGLCT